MPFRSEPVIVNTRRSPIGRANKGRLVDVRPDDLLASVIRALLYPYPGLLVDEVICGCGYPWGEQGYNIGRAATLLAGLPDTTPAYTVSRMCASSLQAIRSAHHAIALGEANVIVACGVESVSRVGRDRHLADPNPRFMGKHAIADYHMPMVDTAERVAKLHRLSRLELDTYAQQSQDRAVHAQSTGVFGLEIEPITLPDGDSLTHDESPRPASTLAGLAELHPLTGDGGVVTAGNSCPLNDGAAAVLIMSSDASRALGLRPRARMIASAVSALDPTIMGLAPIDAVRAVLRSASMTIDDIDLFELNEAFASQVLVVARNVGIDPHDERFNRLGGAIALGHPFGMTGARIMCTLLTGLETFDKEIGLETLCVGGGQGQAMIIERLS